MKIKNSWLFMLILASLAVFSSCKKTDTTTTPPVMAEDGWYISGEATSFTDLSVTNLFKSTTNENAKNIARAGLFSKYFYLTGGKSFTITKVTGGVPVVYGATDTITYNPKGKNDQLNTSVIWGSLAVGKTINVKNTGLYQVCFDVTTNKIAAALVTFWGVIGAATPGGWGGDQVMSLVGTISPETNTYKVENVILTVGAFKFRHSGGWKIQVSDTVPLAKDDPIYVKVNSNYGGTVAALVPGGDDIPNTVNGIYTLTMTWTKTTGEFVATATKTGDYTPPSYPDSMFIAGVASAYGWTEPGKSIPAAFHAVADGPNKGVYWKICYLYADSGFKLSAKNWTAPNMGFADVTTYDPNGVAVKNDGSGNMAISASGLYMIVIDLRNNTKKVSIVAPKVYGIGDAFGGFISDVPANLFTVDNGTKMINSPALTVAGNIRMYVSHAWIPSWWNAEFNIYGTEIQYRNDSGDQTAVPGTAGQVIKLHFDDNTGSIN